MRKLYVCSRPLICADNTFHRHLLGILCQKNNGKYIFQYMLDDEASTSLLLPIFPDKNKIYDDHDTRLLLDDYLPSENDTAFMKEILRKIGLKEYNEWEWLKAFESADENAETKLYETLPDDVILHCDIEKFSENDTINDSEEFEDDNQNEEIPDGNILEHTDIPDELDNDMYLFDDDLTIDFDNDLNNDPEPDAPSELLFEPNEDVHDEIIDDKPEPKPVSLAKKPIEPTNPTITVITKTVTKRVKKTDSDFIAPPPDDPSDVIQQRLEQNIKQRQQALNEQIKTSDQI